MIQSPVVNEMKTLGILSLLGLPLSRSEIQVEILPIKTGQSSELSMSSVYDLYGAMNAARIYRSTSQICDAEDMGDDDPTKYEKLIDAHRM